jgi:ribosomal protein L37AE/L43A
LFPQKRGILMVDKNKEEENITWVCPSCGQRYTTPPTAGARIKCQNCGKTFYTEGIDVENRESRKLQDEIQRRRRREVEADKEHE